MSLQRAQKLVLGQNAMNNFPGSAYHSKRSETTNDKFKSKYS